ncbi:uncharacterized protein BO80DRAFT_7789 [Aspergillus ibericus CBS 121593]|uniref:Uncharacterized protein n=1 Tax=Aspergillus ibericus CBS 121593 TaxID=1448316 RepID=A0A395HFQ8_9EURO|nr:hypothetical protein BO80DRAFT_7789 [Aspergillus ibericus CBS 121593]RAL06303.1 hypothetical protein BO80DRAFT_7789 [Aspergillus ibericus CBS 121593]
MEFPTADPDTQIEVNLMILDYLLCITIDLVLCHGAAKSEGQQSHNWDLSWNLNTIDTIRAVLLHPDLFSQDIHIKIHVLEFAQLFCDGHVLLEQSGAPAVELSQGNYRSSEGAESIGTDTRRRLSPLHRPHQDKESHITNCWTAASNRSYNLLDKFVRLCLVSNNKLPEGHTDIATELIKQAALNEYCTMGTQPRDGYSECAHRVIGRLRETLEHGSNQLSTEYLSYVRLPIDLPPDVWKMPRDNGISRAVHCFLTDLMKMLDPPILIQLERGKLGGLSREETQKLRDKVGL